MGKKNKKKNQVETNEISAENVDVNNNAENVVEKAELSQESKTEQVPEKEQKDVKKAEVANKKKKSKKDKKESKLVRRVKETGSELKKVTWPTFKETVKRTCVVLGIVIFFGVILFAFDYILTTLARLLSTGSVTELQKWLSVGLAAVIVVIAVVWIVVWAVKKKNRDRR